MTRNKQQKNDTRMCARARDARSSAHRALERTTARPDNLDRPLDRPSCRKFLRDTRLSCHVDRRLCRIKETLSFIDTMCPPAAGEDFRSTVLCFRLWPPLASLLPPASSLLPPLSSLLPSPSCLLLLPPPSCLLTPSSLPPPPRHASPSPFYFLRFVLFDPGHACHLYIYIYIYTYGSFDFVPLPQMR